MTARITSQFLVQALIRRTQAEGGFAAVLHKGDLIAGAIVVQVIGPDRNIQLLERISNFSGGYDLAPVATQYSSDSDALAQYIDRRLRSDSDLWIVELDVPNAERLAADVLTGC